MDFFRFPHTSHLAWLGVGAPRDDKVLDRVEADRFLDGEVVVEEKVDGANLGISVDENLRLRFQMRGQYLTEPYTGQFSRLSSWVESKTDALALELSRGLILFGEWCATRHSLEYDRLPDWFLVFDVYDRNAQQFWSTERRDLLAAKLDLFVVPNVSRGRVQLLDLKTKTLECASSLRSGAMEGIVIRREDREWTSERAKLVRPEFSQSIEEHWSRKGIQWNRLVGAYA